ncbi:hypothetical protein [Streptosporangium sp. NPDC051022]|uniref:hypothetical protein n=1 Tax=Streptosporangium sp. NPDC051022 TaxID=3155752 RepID=UPI00342E4B84
MVAVLALISAVATGVLAGRASVKANKVTAQSNERVAEQAAAAERARVESEAFGRAKEIYDHAITELREELERIRTQYERTQEQVDMISQKLLAERTSSQEVRDQLYRAQRELNEMSSRIAYMERVITNLRQQLLAAGLEPAEHIIHGGSSP